MTSQGTTTSTVAPPPPSPHPIPVELSPLGIVLNHFDKRDQCVRNSDVESDPVSDSLDKILNKPDRSRNQTKSPIDPSTDYESPLLKFRSYRLSPYYRTLSKKPLSSLSHSNMVRHDVIMCHHESQGKCSDKSCKAQHWSDVMMSHDDLVNDFVKYLPVEKTSLVRETLSKKLSKLEKDQIQTMAAHIIYKELSHDDHVTISSQWLESTVQKPAASTTSLKLNRNALEATTHTIIENSPIPENTARYR